MVQRRHFHMAFALIGQRRQEAIRTGAHLFFYKGVCHQVPNQDSAFQEEEMPEVEIDIDDLLEVNSDDERASKLQVGRRDRL